MADINQYLNKKLGEYVAYPISDQDQKAIDKNLKDYILQKITRKPFRKQQITSEAKDEISNKVELNIKKSEPLHIVIFFGGYKHFWNKSTPEIDWAEVFTLNSLSEWVAPIISCYKPGVIIEFVSEDWILEKMNNYEVESLEKYSQSFSSLINGFNNHLPDNFSFKYTRLGDLYNKTKMLETVERKLPEGYERWNSLSESEKQAELKRSYRSVLLKDGQGIDRIVESRIIELLYYQVEALPEFSGDYFNALNYIYICFSFGLSDDNIDHWLTIGSTRASTVDFWVGRGVIELNDEKMVERIVSKEQYSKIKNKLTTHKIIDDQYKLNNLHFIEAINSNDWKDLIQQP